MIRRVLIGAAVTVSFVVVATANSGGYRYGISDQAFYQAAFAKAIDPSLFPHDAPLLAAQTRLWLGDDIAGRVFPGGTAHLPDTAAVLYFAGLLLLAGAAAFFLRGLGASWWAVGAGLALFTLRHNITKTGANTLEGYFHPRMIAFALGLFALGFVVRRRYGLALLVIPLIGLIHTTVALWFGAAVVVAGLWSLDRRLIGLAVVAIIAAVVWISRGARMDDAWLSVLADKAYLFPSAWPLYAWIFNLSYVAVLVAVFRRRKSIGRLVEGEGPLLAGLMTLAAGFLVTVPLTASRIALAVQLQVTRVFWLLDACALLYLAWWLIDDLGSRRRAAWARAAVAALAIVAAGRGAYILTIDTPRPLVTWTLPQNDWTDAMAFLRTQPVATNVLADPGHAWRYGSSVRVAALRATILEDTKDTALAMYDRRVARRVAERRVALAGFEEFNQDQLVAVGARFGADMLVIERTRSPVTLHVLYQNNRFAVYLASMMTTAPARVEIAPFVARRWLRNGHVMTVAAWARRRGFPNLPPPESRLFQVSPDSQVRADCYWQPERASRPLLLALHGLESSSDAHYMRGLADQAIRRGWSAVLVNHRNCGGTEHLTPGLYHSGLTADQHAIIAELAADGISQIGIVGYSLGGNLTLKLAGEIGDARSPVKAVVAVSPTIDLDRCVRAIERRVNYPYQWNFVRNLRARMRRKARLWPGRFDLSKLSGVWSIRKFDDRYTAPSHGFDGASDYYYKASSLRVIDRIRMPALILSAEDDPFVPGDQFRAPDLPANPHVTVCVEPHGGHCGFIGEEDGPDRYWAEANALRFLAAAM